MRKTLLIVPAMALTALIITGVCAAQGWPVHKFDSLKFSVSCPDGWDIRKLSAGDAGEMVAIILPKKAAKSGFNANIVMVSSTVEDKTASLDELYQNNMRSMESSAEFPGFKLQDSYKIKQGIHDAYQVTFTYTHPKLGVKLKSVQIYILSGGRMYVFQYAAPTLTYKKYMDEVNAIARSFAPIN